MKFVLFSALLALGANALEAKETLSLKYRDIPTSAAKDICSGLFDSKVFWNAGIFDVQIEGSLLSQKVPISEALLKSKAEALARSFQYKSYSFGRCTEKSGWILAMPASDRLVVSRNSLQVLNLGGCSGSLRGFFVKNSGGRSYELVKKGEYFLLPEGSDGFFGLECVTSSWNQEFYLGPVKTSYFDPPSSEVLVGKNDATLILSWIQKIRLRENLKEVTLSAELSSEANKLAKSQKVQHDFSALEVVSKALKKSKIDLIGEDRVAGSTLREVAFLLWASPRHRDLLLDSKVNAVGISIIELSDKGILISILAGKR